jgi:hypothetical protein
MDGDDFLGGGAPDDAAPSVDLLDGRGDVEACCLPPEDRAGGQRPVGLHAVSSSGGSASARTGRGGRFPSATRVYDRQHSVSAWSRRYGDSAGHPLGQLRRRVGVKSLSMIREERRRETAQSWVRRIIGSSCLRARYRRRKLADVVDDLDVRRLLVIVGEPEEPLARGLAAPFSENCVAACSGISVPAPREVHPDEVDALRALVRSVTAGRARAR